MSSLLIKNGHVLDLDRPFERADILVDEDRIVQVGGELPDRVAMVIDATGKVVMPGLINAHTHSGQILDRGIADNSPLDLWLLQAAMGARQYTEEEIYALTAWSVLVQVKTGCTACLDHVGVRPDRFEQASDAVMQAYVDTGFRAAVAPSVGDMEFFTTLPVHLLEGEEPPTLGRPVAETASLLDSVRRFLQSWRGRHARIQPYIGPGAPQRCSDRLLGGCFELSDEFDAGVHTHLLEARSQWFACQQRFGCSPVSYFDRKGWLSPRLSCAHGVWLSEDEAGMLAENGTTVAHNPVSNLRLGSGIFNLQMAVAKGTPVALGADGAASNDNQNMWEVLKLTSLLHNLYGPREQWIDACEALRLCWQGGAHVLRQDIGAIRPGYQADLVILGGPELFLRNKLQMIPSLVYGELGQSVETVLVAGKILLRDRKPTQIDEASLRERVAAIVAKGVEQMTEREAAFEERRGYIERILDACGCLEGPPARVALLN
jgi:cytosine/adenosine deaminase-related metal-dependent hydrolase